MKRYWRTILSIAAALAISSQPLTALAVDVPSIQSVSCICTRQCTGENIDGSCPVCRDNYLNCQGEALPAESGTEPPSAQSSLQGSMTVRSFEELSQDIRLQQVALGTDISALRFPASLRGEIRNERGERESVMIAVAWELDPTGSAASFQGNAVGEYRFIPVIPSRYSIPGGMELPSITVIVGEGGTGAGTVSASSSTAPQISSGASSSSAPSTSSQSQSTTSSQPPEQTGQAVPLALRFEQGKYEAMKGVPSLTAAVSISGGSQPQNAWAGSLVIYMDNQETERKAVTSAGTYSFSVKTQELAAGQHILRAEYIPAGEKTAAVQASAELEIKGGSLSVQTMPSASYLTYGQTLKDSDIHPGIVVDSLGAEVKGTFRWKEPDYRPKAGPSGVYPVVFEPEDESVRETMELQVQVGVRPAPLTVTEVSSYGRVYDGSRRLLRSVINFEGKPEGVEDRVIVIGQAVLGAPSGGGRAGDAGRYTAVDLENLSLGGLGSENYTLDGVAALEDVPLERAIEITPAKLTVSVREPVSITVGDPMPELAEEDLTVLGLVPGEAMSEIDFDGLSTVCTPETSRDPASGTIRPDGLEADNYTLIYAPTEFTVKEMVFQGTPYDVEGELGQNGWYTDEITLTPNESAGRFQFISIDGGRTWDDSAVIKEDGVHELSILMSTGTGREDVSIEAPAFSCKRDSQPPELGRVKTDYQEDWTNEDVSFTLSCANEPASPVTFYARINGGDWRPISGDSYTAMATQTVQFRAVSESGLESSASDEYEVKIDKAGSGKPSLEGIPSGWAEDQVILTVKGPSPLPGSGIKEFSYSTDGGRRWSDPIPWDDEGENTFIIDEDGDYTDSVLVRIVTNVGSEGESDPYTVRLDSSRPAFELSVESDGKSYEEGEPTEHSVTFSVAPAERQDIPSDVSYFYRAGEEGEWVPLSGQRLTVNPPSDGVTLKTTYFFKAVSGAGAESEEQSVRVLLYRPSFTPVRAAMSASGWSRETVTVTLSGGLPEDQLEQYEYCVTETEAKPGSDAEWEEVQGEFDVYQETDSCFWFRSVSLCGTIGGESTAPVRLQIDRSSPNIRRAEAEDVTESTAVIFLESGEAGEVFYLLEQGDAAGEDPDAEAVALGTLAGRIEKSASFPLNGLEPGEEYTVSLVVRDRAGNLSDPEQLTFVTKPPLPEGVLTEIDYPAETIYFTSGYELNTGKDFDEDGDIPAGSISAYIPEAGEPARILYLRAKAEGDTPASAPVEVSIPPRPENPADAEIDYYAETVLLKSGAMYSFNAVDFEEADGPISISDRIPQNGEDHVTLSYRMPAEEDCFASTVAGLNIPARPDAPPAPAIKESGKNSITLDGVEGAYYRCDGGSWQKSPVFQNLDSSTSYTFEAYIPAAEQNFSSTESQPSEFSTLFALPEGDGASISFEDETINYDDRKYEVSPDEDFRDILKDGESISKYIPAAGSAGGVLYIRVKGDRNTSPSNGEAFSIPARPEPPKVRAAAGLYTVMAVYGEDEEFYLSPAEDAEDIKWDDVRWQSSGSFRDLEAGTEYILYARRPATENSFVSERTQTRIRTLTSVTVQTSGEGEGDGTAVVLVNGTPLFAAEPGDVLEWKATGGNLYTPSIEVLGISGEISGPYREENVWSWRYTVSQEDREIEGIVNLEERKLVSVSPAVELLSVSADAQANESVNALQDYLEGTVPVRALYDNGSQEELYLPYLLSRSSDEWDPRGGEYLLEAQTGLRDEDDEEITCAVRVLVRPVAAAVNAGGDIFLPVSPDGYSFQDIPLPDTVRACYSSGQEETLEARWDRVSLPGGFGTYEGRLTLTGETELPDWAMGEEEISLTVTVVQQQPVSDYLLLSAEGWEYGDTPNEPSLSADGGVSLNPTAYSCTYSGTALDGTVLSNEQTLPEKAGVYTVKAVYQDAEQAGSVSVPLLVEPAILTAAEVELSPKPYDGQAETTLSGVALEGTKNGEELTFGRDFEAVAAAFEDAQVGSGKPVSGNLVLGLSGLTANYTLEEAFQAVGEIVQGEGTANPAYRSTQPQLEELHIVTNQTPTLGDVKLPKGWSFIENSAQSLTQALHGDSQSDRQSFSLRYTSSDPNYADVTEEFRLPVTTVSASVEGGDVQLLKIDTLEEARRLPHIEVSVVGASLSGTVTGDDFYWFSRNDLVRIEDQYATPLGDGVGLLELRYAGSLTPIACLLLEIDSGSASRNSLTDILEIAGDINRLLVSSGKTLREEEREFLQAVIQGISKAQEGEGSPALTLDQMKLLDEFQRLGLNSELETRLEAVPGMPAPVEASAWGVGTAAGAQVNDSVILTLTPVQPTAGAAMELELSLIKNREAVEPSVPFYLWITLPDNLPGETIGEIHQAKGERANDWVPISFQRDGQRLLTKLDSLSKIHLLTGPAANAGEQTVPDQSNLDSQTPENNQPLALTASQEEFWDTAASFVREAPAGGMLRLNSRGYDRMPVSFMKALEDNGQVTVLIQWNGGENILIPAGEADIPEQERSFYPLALLEERYSLPQEDTQSNLESLAYAASGDVWIITAPEEANIVLTEETMTSKEQGVPGQQAEPGDQKDFREEPSVPAEREQPQSRRTSAVPLILAGILAVCLGGVFALRLLLTRKRK